MLGMPNDAVGEFRSELAAIRTELEKVRAVLQEQFEWAKGRFQ
jgi:hypothetical protein